MGKKLNNKIIDVTISYPHGTKGLIALFFGQVKNVVVHIRYLDISNQLIGRYEEDPQNRKKVYEFINHIWKEKDQNLSQLKKKFC